LEEIDKTLARATGSLVYKPQKLAEIGLSITLTSLSLTIITITFAIMERVKRAT